MLAYILLAIGTLIIFWEYFRRKRRCFQTLPPGPNGLPILGNLFQLGMAPHLKFSKWAKKFGKFYTIDLLGKPALVINDSKAMRDLLGTLSSTGKYELLILDIVHSANYGIVSTEGSVWAEQQKFFMKVFRQSGFRGGNQLNSTVITECDDLCIKIDNELKQNKTCTLFFGKAFLNSISTIIWNTITGEKNKSDENEMVDMLETWIKHFNDASILVFMPWLRFIAPKLSGYNQLVNTSNKCHKQVEATFEKHKLARKLQTSNAENMIDAYLEQVENCTDPNSTFYSEEGMKHSFFAVVSTLVAGSETTASTLTWLIHYLVAYPDVQRKLQEEVDAVLSQDENIDLVDKNRFPYLEAVVLEVLRMGILLPIGILHKLLDDVKYEGYVLPKGMFLIANLYYANKDPNIWKDPETFRPERFLEGSEVERRKLKDYIATFQEGRRKCPGEQMAKDMLFQFALRLVNKYGFHPEENRSANEYLNPVMGFLLLPPKLGVVVKPRN